MVFHASKCEDAKISPKRLQEAGLSPDAGSVTRSLEVGVSNTLVLQPENPSTDALQ